MVYYYQSYKYCVCRSNSYRFWASSSRNNIKCHFSVRGTRDGQHSRLPYTAHAGLCQAGERRAQLAVLQHLQHCIASTSLQKVSGFTARKELLTSLRLQTKLPFPLTDRELHAAWCSRHPSFAQLVSEKTDYLGVRTSSSTETCP